MTAVRALRYLYRVPLLLWHVVVDLPVAVLLMALGNERIEQAMVRMWSAGLMRVFGFRLRRIGTPLPGVAMFVANHVSWVDIVALHSQRMMGFVAKREIAGWPLVGWMAARAGTIFHQRGNTESLGDVLQAMLARLHRGGAVGVFPEGRTRRGDEVGPFHARIFTAAVEAGVPVQPVAIRYGEGGRDQTVVAFQPGESFVANFLRLLGGPPRVAELCFLEPIPAGSTEGRRRLAELSRERIVAAMP
ncbi:MAG TPA: lysophospholipid acyltransferase family protein [Luteimonas sp.]|nr:lysophospholipid acyltransferase family protein [Luteimonas sp.]